MAAETDNIRNEEEQNSTIEIVSHCQSLVNGIEKVSSYWISRRTLDVYLLPIGTAKGGLNRGRGCDRVLALKPQEYYNIEYCIYSLSAVG